MVAPLGLTNEQNKRCKVGVNMEHPRDLGYLKGGVSRLEGSNRLRGRTVSPSNPFPPPGL